MNLNTRIKDNILILELDGDLIGEDVGTEIVNLVSESLNDSVLKCAIQMGQVRHMNSSGIGVLITIFTKFKNKGGEMLLINPSDQIKKLFAITKLDSIFQVVSSETEAIDRLK